MLLIAISVTSRNETSAQVQLPKILKKETIIQMMVYKIGDKGPGGGWIFYDKGGYSDGWRYLEAAPNDQGVTPWGCYGASFQGARGTAVGTGKQNTLAIVNGCAASDTAAKLCANYQGGGKTDWFLPSKDELFLMQYNLKRKGIGGFTDDFYWSSSEYDMYLAWISYFYYGDPYGGIKALIGRVRAARAL